MVKLLQAGEVDLDAEALDSIMDAAEEAAELKSFAAPTNPAGDLSDGGKVGRATIYPTQQGKKISNGRANARQAWMWDGTPTVLPLAWNPEGTQHDGARAFLRKRHCTCCGSNWKPRDGSNNQCPTCERSNCTSCNGGMDRSKVIPCFYLQKEKVPFQYKFFGSINCFLPNCPRKDGKGFKTEEDMRIHARSRHRMEYAARQETLAMQRTTETEDLKQQVAELRSLLLGNKAQPAPVGEKAPLYVSDKPPTKKRGRRPQVPAVH